MALIDDVKLALRVDGTDLNAELTDLIAAAKADLELSGVAEAKVIDTDMLIKRAVISYCKANFGYEDPNYAEKFQQSYDSLKNHLVMSRDYSAYDADEVV